MKSQFSAPEIEEIRWDQLSLCFFEEKTKIEEVFDPRVKTPRPRSKNLPRKVDAASNLTHLLHLNKMRQIISMQMFLRRSRSSFCWMNPKNWNFFFFWRRGSMFGVFGVCCWISASDISVDKIQMYTKIVQSLTHMASRFVGLWFQIRVSIFSHPLLNTPRYLLLV